MHYYSFNIGDYHSHTSHLDEIEDIAYRRMLDWCYLHEEPLPKDVEKISRLIRMRTHCESIANVLQEFFEEDEGGYFQTRITKEVVAYHAKSDKARRSAEARWSKKEKVISESNANALQTECESNANHKPITNNQEPLTNNHNIDTKVSKPSKEDSDKKAKAIEKAKETRAFTKEFDDEVWLDLSKYMHNKYDGAKKKYLALRRNGFSMSEIGNYYFIHFVKERKEKYVKQFSMAVTIEGLKNWLKSPNRDEDMKTDEQKTKEEVARRHGVNVEDL